MGTSLIFRAGKQEVPLTGFLRHATSGLASAYCSLQGMDSAFSDKPYFWSSLVASSIAYSLTILGLFLLSFAPAYPPTQFSGHVQNFTFNITPHPGGPFQVPTQVVSSTSIDSLRVPYTRQFPNGSL
jgi:hypothetical protein